MDTRNQKQISLINLTQQKTRKIVEPPPGLTLPFPPHVIPEDFINSKTRKLPSKPPNAFFIYRKVYTKELIAKNLRFKMTDVSPWVSDSWRLEPEEVKTKYKKIAEEVRKIYKQTKLDTEDESETQSVNTSPEPCTNPPLLTPPISDEDNFDFENSSSELFFYDQLINTESQNQIVDNSFNNNTFSPFVNSNSTSTLWQHNPEIFENINAELVAYSKYMVLQNNLAQFQEEPLVNFSHDDINSFFGNYEEEYHNQY